MPTMPPPTITTSGRLSAIVQRSCQRTCGWSISAVAPDRRMAEDRTVLSQAHGGGSMTIRGALTVVLALGLLAASVPAGAEPPGKLYRIGILGDKAADANEILAWQTFRDGLRDHGWKEGVNIRIESRWGGGNVARLPEMAADLVGLKPDLIATRGSIFTGALKAATSSIPIVFLAHADPVETGHVASLARPGGNITGMAVLQTEIGPKCLELLHAAVPAATRIAVLWHSGRPSTLPRAQGCGGAGAAAPVRSAARRSANGRRPRGRFRDHGSTRCSGLARVQYCAL